MVSMGKKNLGHLGLISSMTVSFDLNFGPLFSISLSSNVSMIYDKGKMGKGVRKKYQQIFK